MSDLPRPVEVLHDGQWYPGWVEAVRKDVNGRWEAFVRYTVAPGRQHLQWRNESELRAPK